MKEQLLKEVVNLLEREASKKVPQKCRYYLGKETSGYFDYELCSYKNISVGYNIEDPKYLIIKIKNLGLTMDASFVGVDDIYIRRIESAKFVMAYDKEHLSKAQNFTKEIKSIIEKSKDDFKSIVQKEFNKNSKIVLKSLNLKPINLTEEEIKNNISNEISSVLKLFLKNNKIDNHFSLISKYDDWYLLEEKKERFTCKIVPKARTYSCDDHFSLRINMKKSNFPFSMIFYDDELKNIIKSIEKEECEKFYLKQKSLDDLICCKIEEIKQIK